jgi:hypothetical protein
VKGKVQQFWLGSIPRLCVRWPSWKPQGSAGLKRSAALIESAARLQRRAALAAEVAALEADEDDRAEMLEVAAIMESMRAAG